jgi:undecaprenyl-diphosphatase
MLIGAFVAFEFFKDAFELALIGALFLFLLERYLRWKRPLLAGLAEQHRLFVMLVLGAVLVGIKVSESALSGHSGLVDKAILLWIHERVPTEWTGFFQAVTLMGSFDFVIWLLVISCMVFIALRRWREVVVLGASVACGGLVIYVLKLFTGRERPALWETRWYWGTSFPSGHTLETACFAMALTLCLKSVWPRHTRLVRIVAMGWVLLVGSSRLVLGVHWPTDVLAAACVGMLVPVGLKFLLSRLWRNEPRFREQPDHGRRRR